MGRISFATASLLATTATASGIARPAIFKRQNNPSTEAGVTFNDITPSPELKWVDCYTPEENLQCAYLTVPLDYADPSAGTINVAYMRYLLSEDAPDMMFNPGGPGIGGIDYVKSGGAKYSKQWGYNYVSFDPRGVGFTGPKISCSPSDSSNSTLARRDSILGDLKSKWDEAVVKHNDCNDYNKNTDAKYVGTLANVQDIMHFTELQATLRGQSPEEAMVNFYGVSYGTLMGQTLVATYPDRLRRVLLDGNVYGVAHYQGWEPTGLDDFAHGIWMFNKFCFEAGPEWCTLAEGMNSIDEVKARFDAIVSKLYLEPVQVGETKFDGDAFIGLVQQCMYNPRAPGKGYTEIANATLAVEKGDTEKLVAPSQKAKREAPVTSGDELHIITAADIANRYPWHAYEDWKAATEHLALTAPYGAFGYATLNG
jgi:pimeloyl-ACP methyl ester carboxylesterase